MINRTQNSTIQLKQTRLQSRSGNTFKLITFSLKVRRTVVNIWSDRKTGESTISRSRSEETTAFPICYKLAETVSLVDMCQIRVALFTTMLLAIVEISIADTLSRLSLQCKNVARDAIMNSCKGERIKRSMENVQLLLRYLRDGNVPHGCLYLYR